MACRGANRFGRVCPQNRRVATARVPQGHFREVSLSQVSLPHAWPNGLQPSLLRTTAELRIVLERASLQLGHVGGELGNLREGVVDGHLRKAGTALSR